MLTNIPFVIAWLIYHYSSNPGMLFTALAMTGLTGGFLEAPVLTYVAEVTQPNLRGMLSATSSMSVILGIFTQMLSGSLAHWRTVAMINLTYPIICFLALCLVPESPHWLAGDCTNYFYKLTRVFKLISHIDSSQPRVVSRNRNALSAGFEAGRVRRRYRANFR